MGDDTPLAVISDKPRLISQFFRQNFSQVTNPPIDSLARAPCHVAQDAASAISPTSRYQGPAGRRAGARIAGADRCDWARLKAFFGAKVADIDCTFESGGAAETLRGAIQRIRSEPSRQCARQERAVPVDMNIGPDRVALPACSRRRRSTRISCARACAPMPASTSRRRVPRHPFYAVLIGVGATTVHAYLSEASIVDRHERGLFDELTLADCLSRHRYAVMKGC